jgi:hypothetical protein
MNAQTITITLSGETSGRLVSTEAGVDTPAWFRSSVTLRNLPWLVDGNYTGQVSWMGNKDRPGIIIFNGPNNISSSRGIFIHIGNSPSDSDGCVVIGGAQSGGALHTLITTLRNTYGGPSNGDELKTIVGRNFTIRVIDNRSPAISFTGTWVGVDNNYTYIFSGSNYTLRENGVNIERGTFSIDANQTKFTQNSTHYWDNGTWVSNPNRGIWDLKIISDNRFTITGYAGVNLNEYFNETYAKQ